MEREFDFTFSPPRYRCFSLAKGLAGRFASIDTGAAQFLLAVYQRHGLVAQRRRVGGAYPGRPPPITSKSYVFIFVSIRDRLGHSIWILHRGDWSCHSNAKKKRTKITM
jgi:hypothetical protein